MVRVNLTSVTVAQIKDSMSESIFQVRATVLQVRKLTKFTQEEVEQQELTIIEGERTNPEMSVREGKPDHKPNEIAQGRPACSTNIYYDKYGKAFIAFVASYPLTK